MTPSAVEQARDEKMSATKNVIEPTDVEWLCESSRWSESVREPDHMVFEDGPALAHLLINEVVFLNSHWWKFSKLGPWNAEEKRCAMLPRDDARWTKEESELISVSVNCNDIFAWGCADAEDLPYDEIENLYRMWKANPSWGAAKWCAIRRNQQPQPPVIRDMKRGGVWDEAMEALSTNTQDAEVSALFRALPKKDPAP